MGTRLDRFRILDSAIKAANLSRTLCLFHSLSLKRTLSGLSRFNRLTSMEAVQAGDWGMESLVFGQVQRGCRYRFYHGQCTSFDVDESS
jgi:hypothetical protein